MDFKLLGLIQHSQEVSSTCFLGGKHRRETNNKVNAQKLRVANNDHASKRVVA